MSAPVTEAHRELAYAILFATEYGPAGPNETAQLIADSEAKATVEIAMVAAESADRNVSLRLERDQLRQQVANLTHSNDSHRETAETWRAAAIERDQLRAEVKESKERERVAIASWDEERQRALREGERVEKLAGELAAAKAECERLHKAGTDTWRELRQQIHAKDAALARLRAAIDAAMKEGAK